MRLVDFIRMQNKEMVERGNISFKLLLPLSMGGKWFFYCEDVKTVDDLCKWVEEQKINVEIIFPCEHLTIEKQETDDGFINFMYEFDFINYPEEDFSYCPSTSDKCCSHPL